MQPDVIKSFWFTYNKMTLVNKNLLLANLKTALVIVAIIQQNQSVAVILRDISNTQFNNNY